MMNLSNRISDMSDGGARVEFGEYGNRVTDTQALEALKLGHLPYRRLPASKRCVRFQGIPGQRLRLQRLIQ
jgi:hypothetical protein